MKDALNVYVFHDQIAVLHLIIASFQYAFPLIYLILQRHLKVITIGCKHVLDTEEMAVLSESLVSVLLSIDDRIRNLEGLFLVGFRYSLPFKFPSLESFSHPETD